MQKLEFVNTTAKNPNHCHDNLLGNGVTPICFEHNREYSPNGEVTKEATMFYITVNDNDVDTTTSLVNQFLAA